MASHGLFGLRFGANVFVRILMSLINLQKPITPRYCSIGLYGGAYLGSTTARVLPLRCNPFRVGDV